MMTCTLAEYEPIFAINLRFSHHHRCRQMENKATNPFSLFDEFACLFRYYFFFPLSFALHILRYISEYLCVDSGIEMDRHDTTKKSRIIELLALSLLLLLLLNDFNAVLYYVENDGAGNCVSVLNIIITIVHLVIGRLAAHCCLFAFMYIFASPLFKEKNSNQWIHA